MSFFMRGVMIGAKKSFLARGMIVGFSIAAPVGAIGLLCIEQTIAGGFMLGLVSGLGAATADMCYGILVALGLKTIQSTLLAYRSILMLCGGIFLCYLGIKKFFSIPSLKKVDSTNTRLLSAYITMFFLTLTNPATIIDFTAVFTLMKIDFSDYIQSLIFVAGVLIGSLVWWTFLCSSVAVFREKVSAQALRYINQIAGIVIFSFGAYSLIQLYCSCN